MFSTFFVIITYLCNYCIYQERRLGEPEGGGGGTQQGDDERVDGGGAPRGADPPSHGL